MPRSKFGRYCADCKRAVSRTCLVAFVKVFPFVPPYLPIWYSSQHKTFPSTSIITSYLEALNCCCKKLKQTEPQKKERESVSCFVPFTHTLLIYEWNNNWNEEKMYSNSALIFPTLSDCAACARSLAQFTNRL